MLAVGSLKIYNLTFLTTGLSVIKPVIFKVFVSAKVKPAKDPVFAVASPRAKLPSI